MLQRSWHWPSCAFKRLDRIQGEQGQRVQHHQLLLTLSQQASKALYDASSQVPGADVGSDPSRAFMLADERLFSTVCMRVMCACHVCVSFGGRGGLGGLGAGMGAVPVAMPRVE